MLYPLHIRFPPRALVAAMQLHVAPVHCTAAPEASSDFERSAYAPHFNSRRSSTALVAIVQPVHRPKFVYAVRFALSMLACRQAQVHAYYAVLGSNSDAVSLRRLMTDANASNAVSGTVVVEEPPGHWCMSRGVCLCGRKKLLASRLIFSTVAAHRFAITLDADTEFQSRNSFHHYYYSWPRRHTVVAWPFELEPDARVEPHKPHASANASEAANAWRATQAKACAGVRAASPELFLWWGDAPVYDRANFDAFWRRIDWNGLCAQPAHAGHTFEHAMYLCFQLHYRGWALRVASHAMQYATLEQQKAFSEAGPAPFDFLWSMETSDERLFLYNKDRGGPDALGLSRRSVERGMRLPFPAPGCRDLRP